jgi:hypothetical protein
MFNQQLLPSRPASLNFEQKKRRNTYGGQADIKKAAEIKKLWITPGGQEVKNQAKNYTLEYGQNLWNNPT